MYLFVSHGLCSLICFALFLERMHCCANLLVLALWYSETSLPGCVFWCPGGLQWKESPSALEYEWRRAVPASRLGKASRPGLGCNRDCLTLSPALCLDCQCGSADLAVAIPLLVPFCFCFLLSASSFKLSKGVNPIGSVLSALCFWVKALKPSYLIDLLLLHHGYSHCPDSVVKVTGGGGPRATNT